jgi:acyl carrier protein
MTVSREDIQKRLNDVFREVFEDNEIEIHDKMTAADIEEWDSLMHIVLVIAAEKVFGVKLNAAEVGKLKNVGEMIDAFISRLEK